MISDHLLELLPQKHETFLILSKLADSRISRLNKGQILVPSRRDNSREMGSAAESPSSFGKDLDVDAAGQAGASGCLWRLVSEHLQSSY